MANSSVKMCTQKLCNTHTHSARSHCSPQLQRNLSLIFIRDIVKVIKTDTIQIILLYLQERIRHGFTDTADLISHRLPLTILSVYLLPLIYHFPCCALEKVFIGCSMLSMKGKDVVHERKRTIYVYKYILLLFLLCHMIIGCCGCWGSLDSYYGVQGVSRVF